MTEYSPSVPPMTFSPPLRQERPAWPTVLGIIALVLGILSVLGGCTGLISPFFMSFFEELMDEEEFAQMAVVDEWMWLTLLSAGAMIVLAAMLITASAGLLARKAWAATLCVVWAIAKLLVELALIPPTVMIQSEAIAAATEADPNAPAGLEAFVHMFGWITTCGMLLFAVALPVFMLIWFARHPVREEVARWRAEAVGSRQ